MIYKLKNIGCDQQILRSLYYSLFQSHLTYGLCVWGTAHFDYIHKLFLTQKRALRAIAGLDFNASTKDAFPYFQILKIHDLFKFQYASLMWDQDHSLLPECLNNLFVRVADTHSYETRSSAANKLSINVKIRTKTRGESLLQYPKVKTNLKFSTSMVLLRRRKISSISTKNIFFHSTNTRFLRLLFKFFPLHFRQ